MLSPSLVQQIKCRWREFRREPSAFFWVVFMPIVWMLALGFAFSKPRPETYGVGWLDATASASGLLTQLESDSLLRLRRGEAEALSTAMKRGEISLIIAPQGNGSVVYQLDPTHPEAARAKSYVNQLVQKQAGQTEPVATTVEAITAQGGRYVDFLIPGLLGLSIMTSSLFGVGMTIVSNRKENLLKRYLATPMRAYEYIVSHLVGRLMVLAAEFAAVMIAGMLIFRFEVYGNFLSCILFAVLGAAAFTALALLCGARTRSIPMISGLTNLISLPMMMLSGVFFSKNNFPDWLIQFSNFLPLTALNDGLRKIALEGQPLSALGFETAVLGVYIILGSFAAQRLFKWF